MQLYFSRALLYGKNHQRYALGIAALFVIAMVTGSFLLSGKKDPQALTKSILQPHAHDHIKGDSKTAHAILIEYSDFECRACSVYHSVLKQLESDMGHDVAVIYRHFPLSAINPNADLAARAAEAAGMQEKFFEMHDKLFETQDDWMKKDAARYLFIAYAKDIGLDVGRFDKDLDSKEAQSAVQENKQQAKDLGLKGAPSFFINGIPLPVFHTYAEFKSSVINNVYKQ